MPINIMDPRLGVQNVLEPAVRETRLPRAQPLAQTDGSDTGLAELYRLTTLSGLVARRLKPKVLDEELLRPEILNRNLESALETLRQSRNPEVRRFVRDDLGPLLEDAQLLKTYTGLMVGG